MTRRFVTIVAIVILASSIAGGIRTHRARSRTTSPAASAARESASIESVENDYDEVVELVSSNYAGDVDYEKATQAAIQSMLFTLDPHSLYFPYAEFKKLREEQDARFFGIGVSILQHRDGVYVQAAVQGTPAARAGLRYGDRIVEVDGKDARDWSSEQVSKNVRGAWGQPVELVIERAGEHDPLRFTIVRDQVALPTIRDAFIIRPGTGYIGLTGGFSRTTTKELRDAISSLRSQGARQLILDLRNNPGGLLPQAVDVASEFLARDDVVVSVQGRSEYSEPKVYKSTDSDPNELPLVVLINRNSASASEIVAGAIQDHGRGLIVGERSFGKGLVQEVISLPFNTGLALVTARYYTPYGRSLQRDYSSGSLYDYYTRHEPEERQDGVSVRPGQPSPNEAAPVDQPKGPAVRTAAGRIFYGGGGIAPDIEAKPLSTTPERARIGEATFYFVRTLAAGLVPGLEAYRVETVEYGHSPKPADFTITDRVLEAFSNFTRKDPAQGLQPAQIDADLEFVKLRLREEIVTAAFSSDAGQRVLLESDPQTLRGFEVLPDAKRLAEAVRNGTPLSSIRMPFRRFMRAPVTIEMGEEPELILA
jgi:carboxyl-terminal processing protease